MHGRVAPRIHGHDLDEAARDVAGIVLERPMHGVAPLVVELRDLLAGQVGPQPRQRVEGIAEEPVGAGGGGAPHVAAEDNPRSVGGRGRHGQHAEGGEKRLETRRSNPHRYLVDNDSPAPGRCQEWLCVPITGPIRLGQSKPAEAKGAGRQGGTDPDPGR